MATRFVNLDHDTPRMLLALLIYSYATGIFSSRSIEQSTHDRGPVAPAHRRHPSGSRHELRLALRQPGPAQRELRESSPAHRRRRRHPPPARWSMRRWRQSGLHRSVAALEKKPEPEPAAARRTSLPGYPRGNGLAPPLRAEPSRWPLVFPAARKATFIRRLESSPTGCQRRLHRHIVMGSSLFWVE